LFPTPCREAAITGFGDHPNASITRCIARAFGSSPRPNRVIDRRDMGDQHTAYAGSVHLSEGDLLADEFGHAPIKARGEGRRQIASLIATGESWIRYSISWLGGVLKQAKTHQRPFLSHL